MHVRVLSLSLHGRGGEDVRYYNNLCNVYAMRVYNRVHRCLFAFFGVAIDAVECSVKVFSNDVDLRVIRYLRYIRHLLWQGESRL